MTKQDLKIVSGGQTGVDQGALEAALGLGLVWGGWVPKGWRAENGTVPEQFRARMQEHASANYIVRTRQNVADSHATLILTDAYPLSGGTQRTRDFCMNMMKSHFVVSFGEADAVGKVCRRQGAQVARTVFRRRASRAVRPQRRRSARKQVPRHPVPHPPLPH